MCGPASKSSAVINMPLAKIQHNKTACAYKLISYFRSLILRIILITL
jgi:hypothetical protein